MQVLDMRYLRGVLLRIYHASNKEVCEISGTAKKAVCNGGVGEKKQSVMGWTCKRNFSGQSNKETIEVMQHKCVKDRQTTHVMGVEAGRVYKGNLWDGSKWYGERRKNL